MTAAAWAGFCFVVVIDSFTAVALPIGFTEGAVHSWVPDYYNSCCKWSGQFAMHVNLSLTCLCTVWHTSTLL